MPAAVRPSFEHDRLHALDAMGILAQEPSPNLDQVLRSLMKKLRVPIACISIVDETKQYFINRIGTDIVETPRSCSFCAHTILNGNAPMEVQDASVDPRFRDNPLVTGKPFIHSYIGVPLLTRDRLPIGALCLMDRVPRTYCDEDVGSIVSAARVASMTLLLHGARHLLKRERAARDHQAAGR